MPQRILLQLFLRLAGTPTLALNSCLTLVCGLIVLVPLRTEGQTAPVVPSFERMLADGKHIPAVDGRFLAGELNCGSCHAGDMVAAPKPAPILDDVGTRAQATWIRKFIEAPHEVKPGTTMPSVLSADPKERAAQADSLTHYLLSLNAKTPEYTFASTGAKLQGEQAFFRVGCAACHQHKTDGKALTTTVPLGNLPAKYTLASLGEFLRNPLHVRPGGRMPSLNLSATESQAIASWLLDTPEIAQIKFSYYEGSWNSLPDFSKLTPVMTGEAEKIDVSLRKRNDNFALRFESGLKVDKAGEYTFFLGSDDGSAIYVDGKQIGGPTGVHPYQVASIKTNLEAGGHLVVIEYFEAGGEEKLTAELEGPGIKRQPLENFLTSVEAPPEAPDLSFHVDANKAAKGKRWFASLGCANCHQHKSKDGNAKIQVASTLQTPAWTGLRLEQGCLADDPKSAPRYHLNAVQKKAIKAAARQQAPRSAVAKIHQSMATFNCYACHTRNEVGGVEADRQTTFQTTMKEMGEEGSIPPKLDEAGAKLTDFWLDKTLRDGAKDRPYMHTRMPKFGLENVGGLRSLLVEADQQPARPPVAFTEPLDKVKQHGRQMVGIRGFSCTQCHPFGRFPSKGIQSVDFVIMTKRLRKDWFMKYVANPQAYRPRTRMPTAWPVGKPSQLTGILEGDSQQQIAAVWEYLSDGPKARIPDGMVTKSMELVPINEAIIYRNFIEGAGPRAIGVGYPEHVHQAFDANDIRIALLWEGRYIDASRHWSGRGQGYQPPAGDNVLKLHAGAPFAILDGPAPKDSWPNSSAKELGFRFGGYQLDEEQRPTFLYQLGKAKFTEHLVARPDETEALVRRDLTVVDAPQNLFFRAAAGASVEKEDGWYVIDKKWRTRIVGTQPIVRDGKELLVPVPVGKSAFQQEFLW